MKNRFLVFSIVINLVFATTGNIFAQTHKADDPKMDWWKEAKFGLLINFGLYSIPAGEWNGIKTTNIAEWIMTDLKIPVADYKAFANQFNPSGYNAEEYVLLAKEAGMKYIVIDAKHHEGFAMFKSADPFNIVDATPYKKDVVKQMADACKKYNMPFGIYYSHAQDWTHPGGGKYCKNWDTAQEGSFTKYIDDVSLPQVKELIENYNPKLIWWDTPAGMTPELAKKFTDYLSRYPKLILNNRLCDKMEGDFETPEQYIPATGFPNKNWESCMTMNNTWGYSKFDNNWKSTAVILESLIDIASKGGNYLLNVGPTPEGLIPQPSINCLKEVGAWMKVNGEAIYGTTASPFANLKWGKATQKVVGKTRKIYLNVIDWPTDGKLVISGLENKILKAYPLAKPTQLLSVKNKQPENTIDVSNVTKGKFSTVIVIEVLGKAVINEAPVITSESSVYTAKVAFDISCNTPNGTIHYTTDGTEPTVKSQVATAKIMLEPKANLVVKARTFLKGLPVSDIAVQTFKKEKPIPALEVSNLQPGLSYKLYSGSWTNLPDFSQLTPVKTGVVDKFDLSPKLQALYYGFVFNGYINVPETNVYTFYLTSDDGSKMIVDDTRVLDNDGAHGMDEKKLEVSLAAGYHKISVLYFQHGGGDGLKLEWKGIGGSRSEVQKEYLSHANNQ